MNLPTHDLSPNSFRRILVAHGRATTPGVFDMIDESDDASKLENKSEETLDQVPVTKPNNDNVWTPISKSKTTEPQLGGSYSFYRRPFKVHGKEAWEFAMRDLGSVDTLLNRYGYVMPKWRAEPEEKTVQKMDN